MIYLSRRIGFSSAHRYYQKKFSEEKNKEIFGKCYSQYGHGHNYVLDIMVSGEVDPQTGMVINLVDIDRILESVTAPLDHHHLNFDVPYFDELVPTVENIARYCFVETKRLLPASVNLTKVRVYEAEDLWADYYG